MAFQQYVKKRFYDETLDFIDKINAIISDYMAQGFRLTVRQLYYQLVAHDVIPDHRKFKWTGSRWVPDKKGTKNATPNYDWVGEMVNDARLAGLIDWDAIEDRTRAFSRRPHWSSAADILDGCGKSFHMDLWEGQAHRVFIIIEKEALIGVLDGPSWQYDVPILAARGYPSASVLREFALNDLLPTEENGQCPVILHLGDHDPSGIDMSRDLQDRLEMFCDGFQPQFERVALNMNQIRERNPPPNPAKTTDSRYRAYREQFGDESWELDALPPSYIVDLVESKIKSYCDASLLAERHELIAEKRKKLERFARIADRFKY